MKRREALKGAGMAFSGLIVSSGYKSKDAELFEKIGTEEVRVVVESTTLSGERFDPETHLESGVVRQSMSWANANIAVYDLATGKKLDWIVRDMVAKISVDGSTTVFLRFILNGDELRIRVSPYGFLMDYTFEGRVRA